MWAEHYGDRPPLSLCYLSAYLKQHNHQTKIIDMNHNADLLNSYLDETPDFICFTVPTPNYKQVIDYVKRLKPFFKSTKFIAGGNHVSAYPTEPLTLETFDYVVAGHGDGEQALLDIVEGRVKEQIVTAPFIENLDSLPLPDYEGLDLSKYDMMVDGRKAITMSTGRGCNRSCFYCGSATIKKVRNHSSNYVINHMKYLYEKYSFTAFYIVDDIFTNNFKRVEEICDKIIWEIPEQLHIRVTTRADLLTQDLCYKMKNAGINIVCIGLESGSNKVLKAMGKQETVEQQRKGVEYCYRTKIKVKGFFIIGNPEETWEDVLMTINFAKELVEKGMMQYADCYILNPIPASPFWQNPEKFGIEYIKPVNSDWSSYYQVGLNQNVNINIKHPYLTEKQLKEGIRLFYQEVNEKLGVKGLTYN
ncbi:MAG: radical SAM protein [Nanoarchaeota archaeon]